MLGVHLEMPEIALTSENARTLPGDVTKADDTRAPTFIAQYGDLAVELGALLVDEPPETHPEGVEERLDMEALVENDRTEREQQRELKEGIDRMFGD
jgi:hypothetical protein